MSRSHKFVVLFLGLVLVFVGMVSAFSAIDVEELANKHWTAIVDQDGALAPKSATPSWYAEKAYLNWVGGPLEGYYDQTQIGEVWGKFYTLYDPVSYEVVSINVLPKFVQADVVFTVKDVEGEKKIPVSYLLVFNDAEEIIREVWRVDQTILRRRL